MLDKLDKKVGEYRVLFRQYGEDGTFMQPQSQASAWMFGEQNR